MQRIFFFLFLSLATNTPILAVFGFTAHDLPDAKPKPA